ncbi:hypothetical protein A3759_10280 [Thalassolituus sp. HI0120]|nr:hypothetical protein A3759_10280 [Thalassolituus sp. HI0120]
MLSGKIADASAFRLKPKNQKPPYWKQKAVFFKVDLSYVHQNRAVALPPQKKGRIKRPFSYSIIRRLYRVVHVEFFRADLMGVLTVHIRSRISINQPQKKAA